MNLQSTQRQVMTDYILNNSFDILQYINNRILLLPIKIKWRWVEYHKEKIGEVLNLWAKTNQLADIQAKAFMDKCCDYKRPHITMRLIYEHWAIYFKGVKQS